MGIGETFRVSASIRLHSAEIVIAQIQLPIHPKKPPINTSFRLAAAKRAPAA